MELTLTDIEARVLGSLVEKQLTTPDYYPLTLNSLITACNQKSSRNPVMSLDESEVVEAIDSLRRKRLVWEERSEGSRAKKYDHNVVGKWEFGADEVAVLGVLLLRGPQTVGEIRTRTGRMHEFESLEQVGETLSHLATRDNGPFVTELPRRAGEKEVRYVHLLCGEPDLSQYESASPAPAAPRAGNERIDTLEQEVRTLREELTELKNTFDEFRRQFD